MASPDLSSDPAPEVGRLQATFLSHPLSAHAAQWDSLWKESYTPWDRGGPSSALNDLLASRPELFPNRTSPSPSNTTNKKPKALVPGCGRGHDVLLLSAFGYDVTGLDVSETSMREAAENEKANADNELYQAREGVQEKGKVTWLKANFFGGEDDGGLHKGEFDLVYDYTFFCALPPEARTKWAKRMSELLNPSGGRLVCLEWPLTKGLTTGGPPWGVRSEAYIAHLRHPGVEIKYTDDGNLDPTSIPKTPDPVPGALEHLARVKPTRTHKSGYDEAGNVIDFISVWSHPSS